MRGAIRVLGPSLLLAAVASAMPTSLHFRASGGRVWASRRSRWRVIRSSPRSPPPNFAGKGAVKAKTATLEYREGPKRAMHR